MKKIIFLVFISLGIGCDSKKKLTTNPKENVLVFVMVGQSIMAGRGLVEPQDKVSDPNILFLNKEMILEIMTYPYQLEN